MTRLSSVKVHKVETHWEIAVDRLFSKRHVYVFKSHDDALARLARGWN